MIHLIFLLILVGVALYCVNTLIPMDPKIKTIINVVVVLAVLFWLFESQPWATGARWGRF